MAKTPRGRGRATPRSQPETAAKPVVTDAFGNVAPTTAPPIKRPRGRPVTRTDTRQMLRDGAVRGRNGEVLTRSRISAHGFVNEFDIPESARDKEYDLYWARSSCHGKPDQANINALYDNGWRPASPKNYPRILPDQAGKQTIERDGLILMERPWALTEQSLAENLQDALDLRTMQAEAFGSRKLPRAFGKGMRSKDGKFDARKMLNREAPQPAPREARPTYEYASPDDDS
jgi:hypothetical protein